MLKFVNENMASCYGDNEEPQEHCHGLSGQDRIKHILPITWKLERHQIKLD